MNKEDLILGLLSKLLDVGDKPKDNISLKTMPLIGEFVIVRTYSAGVHAGFLEYLNGDTVILNNSYRLWRWNANEGVNSAALNAVASYGVRKENTKIDAVAQSVYLTNVLEVIKTSNISQKSIMDFVNGK